MAEMNESQLNYGSNLILYINENEANFGKPSFNTIADFMS